MKCIERAYAKDVHMYSATLYLEVLTITFLFFLLLMRYLFYMLLSFLILQWQG